MDEKKLKKLMEDSIKSMDFQVITLDGKNYCVFNDSQIKKFFEESVKTLWDGLMMIIEEKKSS